MVGGSSAPLGHFARQLAALALALWAGSCSHTAVITLLCCSGLFSP